MNKQIKGVIFKNSPIDPIEFGKQLKRNTGETYKLEKIKGTLNSANASVQWHHVHQRPLDEQMILANIELTIIEEILLGNDVEGMYERLLQQAISLDGSEPKSTVCGCFSCRNVIFGKRAPTYQLEKSRDN
ncbi:hypothetical protein [Pseudomonas phage vB_PaeM_PS119XW]|uniref:Uncharacterized protein n=1 Tax=Pseudomonas phage vB_PaeM_PS119XW TaxID=2601632 RepID=A0A5C1K7Q2_9CAUD|nr:hypothetical protein PP933_gp247 [Pseudomonas phage vB_PaeM_PS119XW]QEM41976.1 hypothetical protein [Pseudomonas phage vB_PaeM_PS119XW]